MAYDIRKTDLPVVEIVPQVRAQLAQTNTVVISAPAGAGKSTILPIALFDQPWLNGKKILMLEPRRLAAKTIAARMSSLLEEKAGETVGYRIRFESNVGPNTKIEVLTEGILTRMLHQDNELKDVGMVIFDEFHERSIHADVALALCREAQQVLRPDLRIMVMSATLNIPQLKSLLKAPIIESAGRQYPVEIKYEGDIDMTLIPEMVCKTVSSVVKSHEGDVLVFLPGQGEILKSQEILQKQLRGFAIHALYGMMPVNKQLAAILPDKTGKRKVVLATSIAETSLTIEGIKIVVDCGYGRTSKFDPNSSLTRLETVQISQDSADQRAGRAGRLSAGFCFRLWSKATHERLATHRTPEIEEADLASLALDLAKWGIKDPAQLVWLSPPPPGHLAQAIELLHQLEVLQNGQLTPHGENVHRLPCHPRIAHMLLMAQEHDQLALATDIAALIEERDPLGPEAGIDINTRIEVLRRQRGETRLGKKMVKIEKTAASYRKIFDMEADNGTFDSFESGVLLSHAYPERIACARPGNNAQFQLSNGRLAMAGHKDDLAHESWLAVAHVDARQGMGKIFLAAPLNPRDLAPLVKEKEVITWDTRLGGVKASKDLRIGNIILRSTPLPSPNPDKITSAICDAIKNEGEQLLDFNEQVVQWQARVMSLRKWRPAENWPDVSTQNLLIQCDKWLTPYLIDIKKPEDLKKIDLHQVLFYSLTSDQQKKLDQLAPAKVEVPSGSKIAIQYKLSGEAPVLAVRLQEVFGLADTPTVNEGQTPVIMHLLSPGFKPVQVTSDLRSFWDNTYFEVRKELKGRYPKHVWPDAPWEEKATRGIKKRS